MSSTQFQNDNLTVNLKREPGCKVRAEISVSPVATQAAYQKAIKIVSKEVSIPGFRKGKAPADLIQKSYAKHIDKEWRDILLNTSFEEALTLTKVMPFDNKSITDAGVNSLSLENGSAVFVTYEAAPDVPTVDPKTLKLKNVDRRAVTDKDIHRAIEDMRLQHSQWTEVNDRPVQEGDYVDIDIDKIDQPSYNLCKNARFEVAEGKMGNWMRHLIIGHSPGDMVEGMSEKDPHVHDESCSHEHDESCSHEHEEFKPTLCRITIKGIKTASLPNLDDDFAKKLEFQNFDDLKTKLTASLNREADEEHQQLLRAQIEKELVENYVFDIPLSLIKDQLAQTEQNVLNSAKARKPADEVNAEVKEIQDQISQKLQRDFRLYFLTNRVASDQKIQVSQDELMHEMMRQIWLQSSGQSIIDKSMDPKEVRSRLHTHVLITKAIDFLIENASKAEK